MNEWTSGLHKTLLEIAGLMNDPRRDAEFLARAGVVLDRPMLPLLSRIGTWGPIGTVELAALVGRDHSTVSRQATKLEEAGLVRRVPTDDKRMRLLEPTAKGRAMLAKLRETRHVLIERHFRNWSQEDKDALLRLLTRAAVDINSLFSDANSPRRYRTKDSASGSD